jgi:Phage tail tube protein
MQTLGKAFVKMGGLLLESMPGAKLNPGGVKRTPVTTAAGAVHYSEEPVPATIECEIAFSKDTKILDLNKFVGNITFECDTGQVFVVRDAFVTEPGDITAAEGGKVPFKFAGNPADQVN